MNSRFFSRFCHTHSEEHEQQQPEQQRAGLSRPEAGDLVPGLEVPARVARDVAVLEAVVDEGVDDAQGGERHQEEGRVDGALRAQRQVTALFPTSEEARHHPPDGDGKRHPERELTQDVHPVRTSSAAS
jgi:hypothetical protein